MKTTKEIFEEIKKQGFISKSQLQLIKNRCNREQKDLMDYDILGSIGDGCGIPITEEQGEQGLRWLKKFQRRRKGSLYGFREDEIINNSTAKDFHFLGFYDAGNGWFRNFLPIYELNGMEYVPMSEPYIIG